MAFSIFLKFTVNAKIKITIVNRLRSINLLQLLNRHDNGSFILKVVEGTEDEIVEESNAGSCNWRRMEMYF